MAATAEARRDESLKRRSDTSQADMSKEVPARQKQRLPQRSSDVRELNNTHFGGYLTTKDSPSNVMAVSEALTQSMQKGRTVRDSG